MNLGDGLLFELENGKPRLILLNHGAEKKPAKLSTTSWKTPVGQRSRQASRLEEELQREEVTGKHREARRRTRFTAAGTSSTSSTHDATGRSGTKPLTSRNTPKTNHRAVGGAEARISDNGSKNMPSSITNCKTGLPTNEVTAGLNHIRLNSLANGVAGLKEGVVYLTNQQLQQLISSIHNSASANQSSEEEQHWHGCDSTVTEAAGESPDSGTGTSEEKENNVLIWLGDRETESRVSQNDKKTRWRRELDEQVAVKQNRVAAERQDGDGALSAQCSARELPAVFKSNFRRREDYAEECVKGEEKRGEERRWWLEQLDRQKMENTTRRRQEKDLLSQTEDYEHWAMHFDSLHMRRTPVPLPTSTLPPTTLSSSTLPTAPGRGTERVDSEVGRVPSSSLSLVWDNRSSCGGAESVGRASVDTAAAGGYINRHVRTMTALLDPAQIEERERRRIKQLELQRAIEAQVEERRQRREREEQMRREEEQMEERRVEEERRQLQRQYELNTLRERQKEEKQFLRQQLLYESVQSAQQEALHLKQKQRLIELTRKGHDVGRLLESIAHNGNEVEEVAGAEKTAEEEKTIVFPCRDISVQTDIVAAPLLSPPPPPAPPGRRNDKQNPRLPGVERGVEREGGEKKGERRGGEKTAGDLYERFARTDNSSKRVKRRPDWNVNRPSENFVPASERYPPSLQRSRQEARLRRQADLLALQQRSCPSRTDNLNPGQGPGPTPNSILGPSSNPGPPPNSILGPPSSPPVPAVRHGQKIYPHSEGSCLHPDLSTTPPSQLDFVPYIRTDEVYQLHTPHTDPLQMSSPTYLPPAPLPCTERGRPSLLHNKSTNAQTHRQQEILRGLAQLRQGLLQKQRELESSLNPHLNHHDNHLSSSQ